MNRPILMIDTYKLKVMEIDKEMTQGKAPKIKRQHFLRKENQYASPKQEISEINAENNNYMNSYQDDLIADNYIVGEDLDLLETNENYPFSRSERSQFLKNGSNHLATDLIQFYSSPFYSLIQLDSDLCIKAFSPEAINQINIRKSDIGRPVSDLTNCLKNTDLIEEVERVLQTNTTIYKQVENKKGNWYSLLIEPLNQDSQEGLNITFHDITDLSLAKQQVDKAYQQLLKINNDHENFIYTVSHDLKSPLNNLEAIVSLMSNENDSLSLKKLGNLLLRSVQGLRQTVNELADIANIEKDLNGEESVELPTMIEEIKLSLQDHLNESFAILKEELNVKEINFSKKNLRCILHNFLSNAIKYRSNNRQLKIEIKTRKEADRVVLSIIDNGIGISEDQIESIFSKFKRISAGEEIEGTGIGLFLVDRIVSNAGAELKVKSMLGKGSNFEVYFPIVKPISS